MRQPDLKQLSELVMLARLKELAMTEGLAKTTMAIRSVDERMTNLRAGRSDLGHADYARFADNWLVWQQQELKRLNAKKAALSAERLIASAALGRAMAEHEVAKKVLYKARIRNDRLTAQRKTYVS